MPRNHRRTRSTNPTFEYLVHSRWRRDRSLSPSWTSYRRRTASPGYLRQWTMSTRSFNCSVTPGTRLPKVSLLCHAFTDGQRSTLLTCVAAMDPHTASLTMTRLQNPVKFAFGKVNDDLKAASSAHKKVGRSLDKVCTRTLLPLPLCRFSLTVIREIVLPSETAANG